jgi:predicted ATPase/DNA-binding CsgD family transcriptional regulator
MPDTTDTHAGVSQEGGGRLIDFPRGSESRPSRNNNLPLQLASFVGRVQEIADLRKLFATEARLVTLTGPGGSGKTRLALAVASDLVEGFKDGVWWVELASLFDPDLVARAVASVLSVREVPGRSMTDELVEYLEEREVLLVLDNCEHLVEGCAALCNTLLHACPKLKILATSREALEVAGETHFAVPSLSFPDPHTLTSTELERFESVRLFVERARYRRPDFVLDLENAPSVAEVCRRLDGIPLAIELAAARVGTLSVAQISGRLKHSLRLLSGRDRTAPERQRTLRAALDWSYELLDEAERELFARLSVFSGGFTLEAAEVVGADPGPESSIEEGDVLDLLGRLVDKSLVVSGTGDSEGELRYRMLEPIRQYGGGKLEGGGKATETRRRHAAWFLALAERAEPELKSRRQVVWLKRLEGENDNLRTAMRWLLEEDEVETAAVRLAWALWLFWWYHGHQSEGIRYAEEMLDEGQYLDVHLRAKAIYVRAAMSYGMEDLELTMTLCEESAELFRQVGDRSGLAVTLGVLGITALQQGDVQRATSVFEEGLELFREVGDRWGIVSTLAHLGIIPFSMGDNGRAARYFKEALTLSQDIGGRIPASYISLYNLALIAQSEGDHKRASELYEEGLALAVEVGDKANAAYCLEGLAGLIGQHGEPRRAVRLYGASEAILETVGAPLYVHAQDRALYERAVGVLRSRLGEEAFEAAWSEGRTMYPEDAIEYALESPKTTEEGGTAPAYPAGLSTREIDVLKLVARGMTNAQIARDLFISPNTVNRHLNSIYHKLGVGSRAAATRFASEHNLL